MFKGSLFERLTPEQHIDVQGEGEDILYKSIALNISRILSTNAGSAEIALDYGRPDLDNMNLTVNESINAIEQNSRLTIMKYEPRLCNVNVSMDKKNLQRNEMSIYIEGFVNINKELKKISFRANLFKNGGVKVYKYGI
ncbi:type VI secretion system baseplate subunit TssE [Sulfurimonas lithotrophica]|uniref:Type VI secretion system baseplate subunit TssE n=1 Tax=Sulfurimonas lithotrophica TaxID=2590022 RepID=A0A5P8NZT0_9BACT|nr:type VI secretion system baseplate subunit TssE [Sulfurimonas lithotrophica]QFR48934.1 type VI secretion system baseplate subunit TssE [Sulfurimonas lithotrophica]